MASTLPLIALLAILPLAAQTNRFSSASDVAQGKRTFEGRCAGCHGQNGEGGRGPALNTGTFRFGSADTEIFQIVKLGVPNTEMPGANQTDDEIWRLVAYVKQLSSRTGATTGNTGDPRAGQALYASRRCANCHMIEGEGSDFGPDLSLSRLRPLAYLRDAIVNPSVDIAFNYLPVSVTTSKGTKIRGIFLNEDDYSIQLRDTAGNPRSFLKANLKEFQHDKESLMPAFPLPAADLDNLVAYLSSLKGSR